VRKNARQAPCAYHEVTWPQEMVRRSRRASAGSAWGSQDSRRDGAAEDVGSEAVTCIVKEGPAQPVPAKQVGEIRSETHGVGDDVFFGSVEWKQQS
jgi:hypothetical protein